MDLQTLFLGILDEAGQGQIIIDGDPFPIAFNTIIYDADKVSFTTKNFSNDFPVLIIYDMAVIIKELSLYIMLFQAKLIKLVPFSQNAEYNHVKMIIAYLFANATTNDFSDFVNYLKRRIGFLNDDTFAYLEIGLSTPMNNYFSNSSLEAKRVKQSALWKQYIDLR